MKRLAIITITLIMSLASCTSTSPTPSTNLSPISPVVTPRVTFNAQSIRLTPSPDKSALGGKIVVPSGSIREPLRNTVVRLARVYWNAEKTDGAVVLDGAASPGAITDEGGNFFFSNIDSADYAIVVGDVEASSLTVAKPDGSAYVFSTTPGQILDVGVLELPHAP